MASEQQPIVILGREYYPQVELSSDGESWMRRLLVPEADFDADNPDGPEGVNRVLNEFTVANFHRGAGTAFADEPHVVKLGRYMLFSQRGGLDI